VARLFDPIPEQETAWREFVETRPPAVRAVAERFTPWTRYRLTTTGKHVAIRGFDEETSGEITVQIAVLACFYNLNPAEYGVFGVDPDALVECDEPAEGELFRLEA
jgi:hypothetical protein